MISEDDRKNLKNISKDDHAKDIARLLNSKGIKPRRSEEYSSRTITRVLRGEQEDINAEWAIFQYYHELKERKEQLVHHRKAISKVTNKMDKSEE
ncbi:MAG: hypothetical protein WBL21_00170 [Salinimicrobium sp.]